MSGCTQPLVCKNELRSLKESGTQDALRERQWPWFMIVHEQGKERGLLTSSGSARHNVQNKHGTCRNADPPKTGSNQLSLPLKHTKKISPPPPHHNVHYKPPTLPGKAHPICYGSRCPQIRLLHPKIREVRSSQPPFVLRSVVNSDLLADNRRTSSMLVSSAPDPFSLHSRQPTPRRSRTPSHPRRSPNSTSSSALRTKGSLSHRQLRSRCSRSTTSQSASRMIEKR